MNIIMINERLVQNHPVSTVPFAITIIDSEDHKDRDGCGVLLERKRSKVKGLYSFPSSFVICIDSHFSSVIISTHMGAKSFMYKNIIYCTCSKEVY